MKKGIFKLLSFLIVLVVVMASFGGIGTSVRAKEKKSTYVDLIDPKIEMQMKKDLESQAENADKNKTLIKTKEKDGVDDFKGAVIAKKYVDYNKKLADAKDKEAEEFAAQNRKNPKLRAAATADYEYALNYCQLADQIYKHWCAPATVAQTLSFHAYKGTGQAWTYNDVQTAQAWTYNDVQTAQKVIAKEMGYTSKKGSASSFDVKDRLNTRAKGYKFSSTPYITATLREFGTGAADKVRSRLDYVISKRSNAPTLLVHQLYLSQYYGSTSPTAGHFITVTNVGHWGGQYLAVVYDVNQFNKMVKDGEGRRIWWEPIGTGTGQNNTLTKALYTKDSPRNPCFVY